jgi:hypothetical protein
MFAEDVEGHGMSLRVRKQNDRIWFTCPIIAITAEKV